MSFICDSCGKTYRDKSPNLFVAEKRPVEYHTLLVGKKGNTRKTYGEGMEIVKELELCDGCDDNIEFKIIHSKSTKVVENKDYLDRKL